MLPLHASRMSEPCRLELEFEPWASASAETCSLFSVLRSPFTVHCSVYSTVFRVFLLLFTMSHPDLFAQNFFLTGNHGNYAVQPLSARAFFFYVPLQTVTGVVNNAGGKMASLRGARRFVCRKNVCRLQRFSNFSFLHAYTRWLCGVWLHAISAFCYSYRLRVLRVLQRCYGCNCGFSQCDSNLFLKLFCYTNRLTLDA